MTTCDAALADSADSAGNGWHRSGQEVLHHLGGVTSDWAPLMDTSDIDEATELLRPAFFPLDIAPCGTEPLGIGVKAEQLPLMSIGYLDMGGEAVLRAADMPVYQVAIVASGHSVTKW